jgi:anthranilate phosphoribosyltransferase
MLEWRKHPAMLQDIIRHIEGGKYLARAEAEAAMEELLAGAALHEEIVRLLGALRSRPYSVDELVGFASAMRRRAAPVFRSDERLPAYLVDTCGTGGDASGTFNISTAAAIVAAAAGARVAKHGNRAVSSRSGSADVLEALGVRIDLPLERSGEAIREIGIGFLFAPAAHSSTRHAMLARRELGGRTIFNLLGPLTNPAGARAQVAGVFAADAVELVARALAELGTERAFVVHGAGDEGLDSGGGLDEISLAGETLVAEVRGGAVQTYLVTPEEFGVQRAPMRALRGGDAAENAAFIRRVLAGEAGAMRDSVIANASAALAAAGVAEGFRDGAWRATEAIDRGAAADKLEELVVFTQM